MRSNQLRQSSSESGSVLIYAVVLLLFFASLSFFFKSSTWPVFTHVQDSRRIAQVELLMDATENILASRMADIRGNWTKANVKTCLNGMKEVTIKAADGRVLGRVFWVKAFNYEDFDLSKDTVTMPGSPVEIVRFKDPVSYKITLDDGTNAMRRRQMTFTRAL